MTGQSIALAAIVTAREFYTWQARACTVRIALDVVERLNRCLSDPRVNSNEEQGGILYGSIRNDIPEITNFEFFRSEHRRGIAYNLGARERARVARLVSARMRGGAEKPLGYFRTHLRPGLFLDQDDFAVMDESFARPEAIALLIRSETDQSRTAGFFFWEDGDIDRRQTSKTFKFESAALLPHATTVTAASPRRDNWTHMSRSGATWAAVAILVPALVSVALLKTPGKPAARSAPEQQTPATITRTPALSAIETVGPDPPSLPEEQPSVRTRPLPMPRPVERQQQNREETASLLKPKEMATPKLGLPAPVPAAVSETAAVLEAPRRERSVLVAVSLEASPVRAAKTSELRKVVGHVPLLGHSFREKDQEFVPAKPQRNLTPEVPGRMAADLSTEFPVDVRVSIDKTGVVTTAEVLNGGGSSFANLAAETASASAWQPAVLGDRQVASEIILHYRFRPAP